MLNRLSLGQKLFLSNALYGIPVIVLMSLMVHGKNKDLTFAEHEKYGNAFLRPLEKALEGVTRHRQAVRSDLGRLPSLQKEVDGSFEAIARVEREHGRDLQFDDAGLASRKREHLKVSSVKKKWEALRDSASGMSLEQSEERHTSLVADLRGMIGHVGDTSNLILDPDLDSYYLMDVTLIALPQFQDRIQESVGFVDGILKRGQITLDERVRLHTYATLLKSIGYDRIAASTSTSLAEDGNFHGRDEEFQKRLSQGWRNFGPEVEPLIGFIRKIAASDSVTVSSAEFAAAADRALSASFAYWNLGVGELDRLLDVRMKNHRRDRLVSVLSGVIALVLASGISWLIANRLRTSLSGAVERLRASAESTNASSVQLVSTSQSLSSATTEQASAIQETVATLNQINAMVAKSLENAKQSAKAADDSQSTADGGKTSIDEMVRAIGEIDLSNESIRSQIEESNRQTSEIVAIIEEIGAKTKVINDIVFQTKLLSFNASVEAARAGENGKGFAVVAEEVGSLAQMSGNAAKEISDMLSASTSKVTAIVEETRSKVGSLILQGKSKVEAGNRIAQKCGTSLDEIVRTASTVNTMIREITQASEEQAKGVSQITEAMQQLDTTTHQNSDASSQTAERSRELSGQAEDLREIVHVLEREVSGNRAA